MSEWEQNPQGGRWSRSVPDWERGLVDRCAQALGGGPSQNPAVPAGGRPWEPRSRGSFKSRGPASFQQRRSPDAIPKGRWGLDMKGTEAEMGSPESAPLGTTRGQGGLGTTCLLGQRGCPRPHLGLLPASPEPRGAQRSPHERPVLSSRSWDWLPGLRTLKIPEVLNEVGLNMRFPETHGVGVVSIWCFSFNSELLTSKQVVTSLLWLSEGEDSALSHTTRAI